MPAADADAHPTVSAAQVRTAQMLIFITPALWSVNYLAARWAPGVIAPHALALGRWAVAALVLALFCRHELVAKRRHIAAEWKQLLVLGALGMWVCGAFVYIGGRSTTAINIGLLYSVSPVLVALASALWLHERLGPRQLVGVALALAGVAHILVKGEWAALGQLRINPGDAWIAIAVACWTAYSLLLRAWPSAFGPLARLTLVAAAGVVVLLPFTLWEALAWLPTELSWKSAGLVLATALLPGAGAYGAFSMMQRALGAARVSMVLYLGPLYSALIGWAVLGERIEAFHGLGALMILPGIWLATRR
ncbi:DMT family transporter [Ideonella sp. A 288]|uniref:DMT family transporter n=1 Tax=Ideonella sp. A 288 TaxID=1962181 RepID=UPI000B4A9232|nr:DMT family transporter [Ideonella sp. A 288]